MLRHRFTTTIVALLLTACASADHQSGDATSGDGALSTPTPVLADDVATLIEGEVRVVDILANDPVADNATMHVTIEASPRHADLVVLASGALSIAAHAGYNGPDALVYAVTNADGVEVMATVRLTIYAAADAEAPRVLLPEPSLTAEQLGVLVNDDDPQSVAVAEAYVTARHIPEANVVHLSFPPGGVVMDPETFGPLREAANAVAPEEVQAWAITWTTPYRVGCHSMTSAFALGYDAAVCDAQGAACTQPTPGGLYGTEARRPWETLGVRPAMMLAGESPAEVLALIARGVAADGTAPSGTVAMVRTTDEARSVRWPEMLAAVGDWQHPEGLDTIYVDNADGAAENWVGDHPGLIAYFTGLVEVPELASNTYLPGAVADHLTSFGGKLTDSSQMSALRWLEAGATASYGTVVEPCNAPAKFPDPQALLRQYARGATILEAYWRSVVAPWEGIFIGEPLARPWGRVHLHYEGGDLSVTSTWASPRHPYVLEAADSDAGPFEVVSAVHLPTTYGTSTIVVSGAERAVYRLAPSDLDRVVPGR